MYGDLLPQTFTSNKSKIYTETKFNYNNNKKFYFIVVQRGFFHKQIRFKTTEVPLNTRTFFNEYR